jgi:hypothetical protein
VLNNEYISAPLFSTQINIYIYIVARMWRLYKTGIGLTTGFIGSHTVTHNYSVYTLQLAVNYSTCRVFFLCLHWLPVFQHRRICSPATLLWRLLLHCRLSTVQLDSQLTTNCTATRLDYWLTDWLTDWLTLQDWLVSVLLNSKSKSKLRYDRRPVGQ